MKYNSIFIIYCITLGFLVGVFSAVFLLLVNFCIHFVWSVIPSNMNDFQFYPLIVGLIGGILVGVFQKYIGSYPKTMHETMHEFKQNKKIGYKNRLSKNFISAVIVLTFGASLGPEAALASLLGGMISWVGDRMKITLKRKEQLVQLSIGAMLAGVFHAPIIGLSESVEIDWKEQSFKRKWKKIVVYVVTAYFGFLGFVLTNRIFPREAVFEIRVSSISWSMDAILLYLPALLVGLLFGYAFLLMEKMSEKLASLLNKPIILALIAGLAIGVLGTISTLFLYSGEHEILSLTSNYEEYTLEFLIFLGIGKALLTNLCFSFGWRGGKIFPAIFASTALGLAFVQVFPFTPGLLIAVVVSTSVTIIFKQPILTIALLLFLLPIQLFPLVCLTCFIAKKIDNIILNKLNS